MMHAFFFNEWMKTHKNDHFLREYTQPYKSLFFFFFRRGKDFPGLLDSRIHLRWTKHKRSELGGRAALPRA